MVVAVLARLLLPSDFGVIAVLMALSQLSLAVADLGLGQALIQRQQLDAGHIATAFAFNMVVGGMLGIGIWASAPYIASFFSFAELGAMLRVAALTFPVRAAGATAENLLQREMRFRELAGVDLTTYALGYAVTAIACAMRGWGAWALVVALLVHALLRTVTMIRLVRPPLRAHVSAIALRQLLGVGAGFSLARLANYAATEGDNVVVARVLGVADAGVYSRAYQLLLMPVDLIAGVVDRVLFPSMSRIQDDRARLGAAYLRATELLASIMLPISVLCFLAAPELVRVALGDSWGDVVAPFRILCVVMLWRASYKVSEGVARAVGAVWTRAMLQVVYAAAVLLLASFGARSGVVGVAFGVAVAITCNAFLMAQLAMRLSNVRLSEYVRAHAPALAHGLALLVVVASARMLGQHLDSGSTSLLLLEFAAVAALGVCVLRFAPSWMMTADMRWVVQSLAERSGLSKRARSFVTNHRNGGD